MPKDIVLDEINFNTHTLLLSGTIIGIEWEYFDYLLHILNDIGINTYNIGNIQEWGQDVIKFIKIENKKLVFHIVSRSDTNIIKKHILQMVPKSKIFIETLSENTNIYNLQKGGNHLVLPNFIIFKGVRKKIIKLDFDCNSEMARYGPYLHLKIYDPYFDVTKYYMGNVFHIDEILTIIPTGYDCNDYIVLFYKPYCNDNQECDILLNKIFYYNYNILCKVFEKEKIFTFNTEFIYKSRTNCVMLKNPPLFNRILIRQNNTFTVIFPDQEIIIKNQLIDLLDNIQQRCTINYHFINTYKLHNMGGNLHCAFKNILTVPPELLN